jgi:tetraacyldisaccharide 4'-kinase
MNPLAPFGKLYGRVMDLRNLLYDRDVLKSYDLGARTISVGNLTTGGTGKTPLVALIAKQLIDNGETVCILTRGYGRKDPRARVLVSDGNDILADAETGGDEPVELALKLNGRAIIIADPNRVKAARWARENFSVTAFILDDGFQHRRARRDLDIVCIDATNPCGYGSVLPAGSLRESFDGLKRADAIVVTRTEQAEKTNELGQRLRAKNPDATIFLARSQISRLVSIEDSDKAGAKGRFAAFTGIGNPANFFTSMEGAGFDVVTTETFPDHHRFTQTDISNLESKAKQAGADGLVTTAKDAVKLTGFAFELTCSVAIAETVINDIDGFKELIISS